MGAVQPGSVFKRCGCRKGRTGLRLGADCPRLGGGARELVLRLAAAGPPGDYATEQDARAALERMREPAGPLLTQ